jgi:HSP20 family molecular chaperone IbpA
LHAQVDIPGIPKEQITLEVEGQTVKVATTPTAAEAAKEAGDSGADVTWHRIERSSVYAPRALRFPENANMRDIVAHADDGVLRLRIAKTADAKRDRTIVKVT